MGKATSYDVARLAKVSRTTVSLVLNDKYEGKVSEETRQRVLSVAQKLNYIPDSFGRGLRTGRSNTIALAVRDYSLYFSEEVSRGVTDEASKLGYQVVIWKALDDTEGGGNVAKALIGRVDGVIVGFSSDRVEDIIAAIDPGTAIVSFCDMPVRDDVDRFMLNSHEGVASAIRYLIALGHTKIAYVSPLPFRRVQTNRFRGYLDALKSAGIPFEEDLVPRIETPPVISPETYTYEAGIALGRKLFSMRKDVTAVAAMSDILTAYGVIEAARELGLKVPEDLSVVGFDDTMLTRVIRPRLTTLNTHIYERSRMAARYLVERIEGRAPAKGRSVTYDLDLVIRESTAPRRSRGE